MAAKFSAKTNYHVVTLGLHVITALALLWIIHAHMTTITLEQARQKAELILDRNLGLHTYFTLELKPSIAKILAGQPSPDKGYDPRWMSSTYALRRIDELSGLEKNYGYNYRPANVNARSRSNEADTFEKAFITAYRPGDGHNEWAGLRDYDGQPFFVFLRIDEFYQESCIRCHDTPAEAPHQLIEIYGSERGFNKSVGAPAGVRSIRIPLAVAFAGRDQLTYRLSLFLLGAFAVHGLVSGLVIRKMFLQPLVQLKNRFALLSQKPGLRHDPFQVNSSREFNEMMASFDTMHATLLEYQSQLEEKILVRTRDLQLKNSELEQYTYIVSHDLKSPLVTIRGFVGLLEHDLQQADIAYDKTCLGQIKKAAEKMSSLLDGLMSMIKLDRPSAFVPVSVQDLVADILAMHTAMLRKQRIEVSIKDPLPSVVADPVQLQAVFHNLIDNAMKFMGSQKHPEIRVTAKRSQEGTLFSVQDNGIGIAPEDAHRVFNMLERLHSHIDGAGLGLAIAKRGVERHGGKIWIESRGSGYGTLVAFIIPDCPASASGPVA